MRAGVIVFPGSNCDRDLAVAFEKAGADVSLIWHKDTVLPQGLDIIGIPGGFSFGDYLRCGAIAARSPVSGAIVEHARRGGHVIGICNGFQILTETGLLPGALIRNAGLKYICKTVALRIEDCESPFTAAYQDGQVVHFPIAHHDGNYIADADVVARLNEEGRVALRYVDNPNGSVDNIAGVLSANKRVLGMMPHPERANDPALGGTDGAPLFRALTQMMQST